MTAVSPTSEMVPDRCVDHLERKTTATRWSESRRPTTQRSASVGDLLASNSQPRRSTDRHRCRSRLAARRSSGCETNFSSMRCRDEETSLLFACVLPSRSTSTRSQRPRCSIGAAIVAWRPPRSFRRYRDLGRVGYVRRMLKVLRTNRYNFSQWRCERLASPCASTSLPAPQRLHCHAQP